MFFGVMIRALDFESKNPSSNPCRNHISSVARSYLKKTTDYEVTDLCFSRKELPMQQSFLLENTLDLFKFLLNKYIILPRVVQARSC